MFDFDLDTLRISGCAVVLVAMPLARYIGRKLKERKNEREAELLRQYPELAEIVESELGPCSGYR
ncbi:MAG: hypothetical protein Q8Q81_14885 [Oxalobacteraceae bacterium]|nr:hypothetical protein [Oxalobacteraceae bacterium]